MRINGKNSKNRTRLIVILSVIIILSLSINNPLFTMINNTTNNSDNEKNDIFEPKFPKLSSSIPNADYFNYYKVIVIDHTKVNGSSNHVDFPLLFSIIDSDLYDNAQNNGNDIAFANNTSWLDHEIELYERNDYTNEAQLITWVRIPLLSTSIDTTIFMFYGNTTMDSRENSQDVWNSNYKAVWHLTENPEYGGTAYDSTINENDGTAFNMESTDQVTGQIDGSFRFNGWNEFVDVASVGPEIKTVEFWMRADTLGSENSYNTGYQNPTATGEDFWDWTNPTYAYTSNDFRASIFGYPDRQDYYNFSFDIPSEATIEGIEVSMEARRGFDGSTARCRISLSADGGDSYDYNTYELSWWSTLDTYYQAGGSTDLWGKTGGWSVSELNNVNFRVRLDESGDATLQVDHLRVRVYYSLASDTAIIGLNSSASISIDSITSEIKTVGVPSTSDIYVDGLEGTSVSTGSWYHVVVTNPNGIDASDLHIATNLTTYYDGTIDEVRISDTIRSADWITTEYNNQDNPTNFYSIGTEKLLVTDVEVIAFDLYGNKIPGVNISMIENSNVVRWDLADANGTVTFEDVYSVEDEYNFSVSMKSDIAPFHTIEINRTLDSILIEGTTQTINLICNISRNVFNVVDVDGVSLDSGWIIVGNDTDSIQNCTIDETGHATFWWLNITPYEYNYTVWYQDINYNPQVINVSSGDILEPNSEVNVTTILTTVKFTVLTKNAPITPVDGASLLLSNLDTTESIVNLTTDLEGKAILRWVNSSGINNANYSIELSFYGSFWDFEIEILNTGRVGAANFTVKNTVSYNLSIYFEPSELEDLETQIVFLNPIDNIEVNWGTKLTLRALFNVTKGPPGYEDLGPIYADQMAYQILEGTLLIQSKNIPKEDDYVGCHKVVIETSELESETIYIVKINAQKAGYVLPLDIIFSLYLSKNELLLNQSENDDSTQSVYWQTITNMSVIPYGIISENFTINYNLNDTFNNTFFSFSIPDISNDWNLSRIVFDIYNVTFEVPEVDINLNITDDYGLKYIFNSSNSDYYYHSSEANNGSWNNLEIILNKASKNGNNSFSFNIEGNFQGDIDIVAKSYFIRDKINVQYSRFNITDTISLLTSIEGWAIKNITFEIYNCYNSSTWEVIDLSTANLNITIDESYRYSLDAGFSDGTGILTIDDRIIYPNWLIDQFLFEVESGANVTFNVNITIEYIQEFYKNQYLEINNLTKIESNLTSGDQFYVNYDKEEWIEDYAMLEIRGISNGPEYLLPSDLGMNITIEGQPYNIIDLVHGQGIFSLGVLDKDKIYTAVIETNQSVIFDLIFIIRYTRTFAYETKGDVTYEINKGTGISGTVQYEDDLGYYLQTINTSLVDVNEYTIQFTITKDHYITAYKFLELNVINRPTLINESSVLFRKFVDIYVMEALNFTFTYVDNLTGQFISELTEQSYIWDRYDEFGTIIETGQGYLSTSPEDSYILDLNTEDLLLGEYLVIVTLDKNNYDSKLGFLYLTIEERLTLINGSFSLSTIYDEIDMTTAKNYSFSYVDYLTLMNITNLDNQSYSYISTNTDDPIGQGSLFYNSLTSLYILDLDTESKDNGTYTITVTLGKENYTVQRVTIVLTIKYIVTDYTSYLSLLSSDPVDLTTNLYWRDNVSLTFDFSTQYQNSSLVLSDPNSISAQIRDINQLPIGNLIDLFSYRISNGTFTFIFNTSEHGLIGGNYYDIKITAGLTGYTPPDPLIVPFQVKNLAVELEVLNYSTDTKFTTYSISEYWNIQFNLTLKFTELNTGLLISGAAVSFDWEYGSGLINPDLLKGPGYYSFLFDTANASDVGAYTINFLALKQNYSTGMPIPSFIINIVERPTQLNSSLNALYISEKLYVGDSHVFIFEYIDSITSQIIINAEEANFILQRLDVNGDPIPEESEFGSLNETAEHYYILDFHTERLSEGEYSIIIAIKKQNYDLRVAIISLKIDKRVFNIQCSIDPIIRIDSGRSLEFQVTLLDLNNHSEPIIGADVCLILKDVTHNFTDNGDGTYTVFISKISDAFFTPETFIVTVYIEKANFSSESFIITTTVNMAEIFSGVPTFYFILGLILVLASVGSIAGYRVYKNAIIPTFVKKVRSMKKAIEKEKEIPDSLLYSNKDVFIGERVRNKWSKLGLSLGEILNIKLEKDILKRNISEEVKKRNFSPLGLLLMKWDERIGTKIIGKYPADLNVSEKTLMQIYGTHEYSGERGIITLMVENTNLISYYTGPENSFYLVLYLNIDDDPDAYEGAMAKIISIILENLEDDSFLMMFPSLFQRLSLYPSLSDEELVAETYQDEIKRMIINMLRDEGVIIKSELVLWLKDKFKEGFIDLDSILLEMAKKDIIKQTAVKSIPSELITLTYDPFMLRTPPIQLLDNPVSHGLPTHFAKTYRSEVKNFFQDYHPTEEDNLKILEILINPQVYETFRLLRMAIVTRQDLEKLKKKGVDDIYGVLKMLWDNQLIKVFKDENDIEYYSLLSDFYIDLIFPKYLLEIIKTGYDQKSKANKVLIEYLNILGDTYIEFKKQKKIK